ncbi:hypothetical protein RQP46_006241 [Phenoliferia psychrophenolica]
MSLQSTPFKVAIPDSALETLKAQLKGAHVARPTYEASAAAGGRFGVQREWLLEAKARWEDGFDWRAQEARINQFTQFTAPIPRPNGSVLKLHFVHERATNPHARTILLLHGWPGSYLEFLDVIEILKKTGQYNIVAPSHPGYAFSDPPPTGEDFGKEDVADLMEALMQGLGYTSYAVQAGDWGAAIARMLAVKYSSVICTHLNFIPVPSSPPQIDSNAILSAEDEAGLARGRDFIANGRGYSDEHRTRPATIAFVVSSSPIALLSWVGEKFLSWTDEDPVIDEVLTNLTLWWLTDTFPTSIYPYRDPSGNATDPKWFIKKPTGYSNFAKELLPSPRSWAATSVNLTWYRYHPKVKGGHFAAMEQPKLLAQDLCEFLDQEWPSK